MTVRHGGGPDSHAGATRLCSGLRNPRPEAPMPEADRVTILNVNHPERTTTGDGALYRAMRKAVLAVLPGAAPGLTEAEMRAAVLAHLPADLYPDGARAGWWSKAVQLDLEARGVLAREKGSPLRWHRTGA
jgi:hypothetical protein